MADSENAAIWEVQASAGDGLEATALSAGANNVLLMNPATKKLVVSSVGQVHIDTINVSLRKAIPENEAANEDNNEIQDMGISGLDIIITGISGNSNNNNANNLVNKLIKWIKDGNIAAGYTKGRFGLRLDNAPQWNVVPNDDENSTGGDYGFHLSDATWDYVGEKKDTVMFTINLSLGGDITNAI